jgi:ABC-type xylose transport system substrate-binding protein
MSEKEVVGRNIAIALGIICMVLAVGLVGAIANYTSIISGKDNTIASLDS